MIAAKTGDAAGLEALLRDGLAVIEAACPEDGKTALLLAAENGHWKSVEMLLRSGANLEAAANDGTG